jgi:hypothetical protein
MLPPGASPAITEVVDPPVVDADGRVQRAVRLPRWQDQVWALQDGEPTALHGLARQALEDAFGVGDFEQDPVECRMPTGVRQRLGASAQLNRNTVVAAALSGGLPGLEVRRYGVPEDALARVEPLERWVVDGPWPLLLDAVPWQVHRLVAPSGRLAFRRLFRRLHLNAFSHRSLAPDLRSSRVRLDLFSRGLRLTSPGGLPRPVTIGAGALRGRWPRNPALASILGGLELDPDPRTSHELAGELGFTLNWSASEDCVVATLRFDRRLAAVSPPAPLSARRQTILEAIRRLGEPQMTALVAATGIPRTTLSDDINVLVEAGLVEHTEPSRKSSKQAYRRVKA